MHRNMKPRRCGEGSQCFINRRVPRVARRNLVIVRAGNASLHPGWLSGPEERTWDVIVSYFGDDPTIYREDDVVRVDSKGPKWPPLKALLLDQPELIDRYDLIWFPDDDLEMTKNDINRFFEICHAENLQLAQPSLTLGSPVTHPLVINNTRSSIRFTNFVEVMAPCFSAECLRRVVSTFNATQSGWGIDWLWPKLVPNPDTGIAIVDEVSIRHTRPLGGPNYDAMRKKGLSPQVELDEFNRVNAVTKTQIEIHRIKLRSGKAREIKGLTPFFASFLVMGYMDALIHSPARWPLFIQIAKLIKSPFR